MRRVSIKNAVSVRVVVLGFLMIAALPMLGKHDVQCAPSIASQTAEASHPTNQLRDSSSSKMPLVDGEKYFFFLKPTDKQSGSKHGAMSFLDEILDMNTHIHPFANRTGAFVVAFTDATLVSAMMGACVGGVATIFAKHKSRAFYTWGLGTVGIYFPLTLLDGFLGGEKRLLVHSGGKWSDPSRMGWVKEGTLWKDPDELSWDSLSAKPSIEGCDSYSHRFPSGRHSHEAEDLEGELHRIEDSTAWATACRQGTVRDFKLYLDRFPPGRFQIAARDSIDALDESFWNRVTSIGTESAYEAYFKEFPDGKYRTMSIPRAVPGLIREDAGGLLLELLSGAEAVTIINTLAALPDSADRCKAASLLAIFARPLDCIQVSGSIGAVRSQLNMLYGPQPLTPEELSVRRFAIFALVKLRPQSYWFITDLLADSERAIEDFRRVDNDIHDAIDSGLTRAEEYNDLGKAFAHRGLDDAEGMFLSAVKTDPNFLGAYHNLAVFDVRKGNFERALELWKFVYSRDPNYPDLAKNLEFARAKLIEQIISK